MLRRLYPEERVLAVAMMIDFSIGLPIVVLGLLSGAASAASEAVRILLLDGIDLFAFSTLVAINRGKLGFLDFGTEKVQIMIQMLIALGMGITLIVIVDKILVDLLVGETLPDLLVTLLFAAFSFVNVIVNIVNLLNMLAEQKRSRSMILGAQIRNRIVMLCSSVIATLAALAAFIPDRIIFETVDTVGALLVLGIILVTLVRLVHSGVLTLLDAPVTEREKLLMLAQIVARFDDWQSLEFLRTRRVGGEIRGEIGLGFPPRTEMAQALAVCRDIEAGIAQNCGRPAAVAVYPVGAALARKPGAAG